jgi:hypothetical protein
MKKMFYVFTKKTLRLSVFALAFFVGGVSAQTPEPTESETNPQVLRAADQVQKAQTEVDQLKDVWDRSRLESTLYDQRAQRAYQRWAAAKKDWKKKMALHKDQAQLEFQLSVEKRKLAFDRWQQALDQLNAAQQLLSAAEQAKDILDTRAHINRLENQLYPSGTPTPAS